MARWCERLCPIRGRFKSENLNLKFDSEGWSVTSFAHERRLTRRKAPALRTVMNRPQGRAILYEHSIVHGVEIAG
jgi:hypothetical protein